MVLYQLFLAIVIITISQYNLKNLPHKISNSQIKKIDNRY